VTKKHRVVTHTQPGGIRQSVKVSILQTVTAWAVRTSLESGYRRVTGRDLPTARDRDTPFRQVLVWATITAAAVAAAGVIVDRLALRPKLRVNSERQR
jgi:hypothetical protein